MKKGFTVFQPLILHQSLLTRLQAAGKRQHKHVRSASLPTCLSFPFDLDHNCHALDCQPILEQQQISCFTPNAALLWQGLTLSLAFSHFVEVVQGG